MTLSGLWTRKSPPKETRQGHPPPSDVRENHWTQLKPKLRSPRSHKATDHFTPDAKFSGMTPTGQRKRDFVLQIVSPRPSVHAPRPTSRSSPSWGNAPAPTSVLYSSSHRQVSQDSPFALLSQCEHVSVPPTGAGISGVVPSTDCHARDLGFEENVGERVDARSSQQFPTVPSANAEITPLSDLSPASAPGSSNASPLYGYKLANSFPSHTHDHATSFPSPAYHHFHGSSHSRSYSQFFCLTFILNPGPHGGCECGVEARSSLTVAPFIYPDPIPFHILILHGAFKACTPTVLVFLLLCILLY